MTLLKHKNYLTLVWVALIFVAAAAPTDFSGDWTLNEQKSNFGDTSFGKFGATTLKVKQDNTLVTIARTGTTPDGDSYAWEEKLSADGKESEIAVYGSGKRKSTMKWSDDKNSFTINSKTSLERNGMSIDITSTEVFKLSDGGKTLTMDVTSTSSFGTMNRRLVYDKK